MNGVAAELLVNHQRSDRDAARFLRSPTWLVSTSGMPASMRSSRTTHSAVSGRSSDQAPDRPAQPSVVPERPLLSTAAYATVIASAFPEDTPRLTAMVQDAGLSRMYGGLHYRFDITAGRDLGQKSESTWCS